MGALSMFGWEVTPSNVCRGWQGSPTQSPNNPVFQDTIGTIRQNPRVVYPRRWPVAVAVCDLQSRGASPCLHGTFALQSSVPHRPCRVHYRRSVMFQTCVLSRCCVPGFLLVRTDALAMFVFQKPHQHHAEQTSNQCARGASASTSAFQMSPKPPVSSLFFIAMISVCKAFSCASNGTIADATAHVFATGAAGVTNADTSGPPTPTFSRVSSPMSIALDDVFKLAVFFAWDAQCSSAVLARPLAGCVLCGAGVATTAAQDCGKIASLPLFSLLCCSRPLLDHRPLSWCLHRGALDHRQAKVVLQCCARLAALPLAQSKCVCIHWRKDFTGLPACMKICQCIGALESGDPDTSHSSPRNLLYVSGCTNFPISSKSAVIALTSSPIRAVTMPSTRSANHAAFLNAPYKENSRGSGGDLKRVFSSSVVWKGSDHHIICTTGTFFSLAEQAGHLRHDLQLLATSDASWRSYLEHLRTSAVPAQLPPILVCLRVVCSDLKQFVSFFLYVLHSGTSRTPPPAAGNASR